MACIHSQAIGNEGGKVVPGRTKLKEERVDVSEQVLVHGVGTPYPVYIACIHLVDELFVVVFRNLLNGEVHRPQAEAYCLREPFLNGPIIQNGRDLGMVGLIEFCKLLSARRA